MPTCQKYDTRPSGWSLKTPNQLPQFQVSGADAWVRLLDNAAEHKFVNAGTFDCWIQGTLGVVTATTIDEQVRTLAEEWREATDHFSILQQKISHPSYLQIIGLGRRAVPQLLIELRDRPGFWFTALRVLTGDNTAVDAPPGDFAGQRAAWLHWAHEKGYL